MKHLLLFLAILYYFIFTGCGKPLPTLEKINLIDWKNDKWGCQGIRTKTLPQLIIQKNKLEGLSENDILSLLGKPDINELYKRNQKFFYYYLTTGEKCKKEEITKRLSIRFNAMGFAKEVSIE